MLFFILDLSAGSHCKESSHNAGDLALTPGSGRYYINSYTPQELRYICIQQFLEDSLHDF